MISAGHTLSDIRGYTLAQVRLFVDEVNRVSRAERLARLYDMRASQAAKKDFEPYAKKLEKD